MCLMGVNHARPLHFGPSDCDHAKYVSVTSSKVSNCVASRPAHTVLMDMNPPGWLSCVRMVRDVTTPQVEPPPPRSAKNRVVSLDQVRP